MNHFTAKITVFYQKVTQLPLESTLLRDLYTAFIGWPFLFHMTLIIPLVWLAGSVRFNFLFMVVVPLCYLAHVHSKQKARLELQIQRRVEQTLVRNLEVTDVETVTWLNALIQESWPSWLEVYLSKNLGRLLQHSLAEHKPRAVSRLVIENFRLGSSPLVVKSAKVYRLATDDKDATLELDVSFFAGEDMRVELLACLSRGASMGLALEGKLYADNLRIEGKLRLGFKFVGYYPYVGQLSVAFVTTPVLGLSVRPLSPCSVDISDLPGLATWLTKSLTTAVESFLVEPYSYVLDLLAKWGTDFGLNNELTKSKVEEMKWDLLLWKYWRVETWKQQVEQCSLIRMSK
eukprot:Gb_36530 [translate_table: standard]